ncbi:MAG: hypothetical protein ABFE01_02345 [Phycisphaerales bacterium]|jgi:hypothetical protein
MTSDPHAAARSRRLLRGATLIELTTSMASAVILVMAVGVLLDGGNRAWLSAYESAHGQVAEDAQTLVASFGSIGRKANRGSYFLYNLSNGTLTPRTPPANQSEAVVFGNAVEFRYWDVPLDTTDTHGLMDATKTATAYALFYLVGDQLKLDQGPYPPGAAPAGGGSRNTTGVTTIVLADNVSVDAGSAPFSHSTVAGMGQGSVRLNVILTNPQDSRTTRVMTTALMRNIWPR